VSDAATLDVDGTGVGLVYIGDGGADGRKEVLVIYTQKAAVIMGFCGFMLVFGPRAARTEIPADERIAVTDTTLLESMGFDEDETVYVWTKGSYGPELTDYLLRMGVVPKSLIQPPVEHEHNGDTVALERVTLQQTASGQRGFFAASGQSMQERSNGFVRNGGSTHSLECLDTSTDSFASAQLQIHNGAGLDFIRIWGVDDCVDDDFAFFVFERCQPDFAAGASSSTSLGTGSTSGSPGDFSVMISFEPNVPIDNRSCIYTVRARFDDSTSNCSCGTSLKLNKVRAQFYSASEGAVHPVAPEF
jgi:hypothetical protein